MRYSSEGVRVPSVPGVYEAKYRDSDERLTIGKASNLRMRVKQGLVKGKTPHSAGRRIRENEDTSKIVVRWAITDIDLHAWKMNSIKVIFTNSVDSLSLLYKLDIFYTREDFVYARRHMGDDGCY